MDHKETQKRIDDLREVKRAALDAVAAAKLRLAAAEADLRVVQAQRVTAQVEHEVACAEAVAKDEAWRCGCWALNVGEAKINSAGLEACAACGRSRQKGERGLREKQKAVRAADEAARVADALAAAAAAEEQAAMVKE